MQLRIFPDKERFCSLAAECNVIPVCIDTLADLDTPVSLLSKIYPNEGPLFLLESVEGGERWGRYSFMGASARTHVRVYADHVSVSENGHPKEIPHHGKPLPVLRGLMADFKPAQLPELPRFWGGLIGYMTYEMVSFFEAIPHNFPKEKPLAHFIIPDELLIFDNIRHTLQTVVPCFLSPGENPEEAYDRALIKARALAERIRTAVPAPEKVITLPHRLALTQLQEDGVYREHVRKTKEYIKAGDIIQAVIAQPFTCPAPPDITALYRAQRYINPSPYLFFMHLGNVAMVGSSPETLVRLENRIATLRPIAGTRPRGKNQQEDRALADEMLSDEKERAEHLMLVDLGRNDLGRVAETGTVQVTDLMVVERYSHVMHLVSNITADLLPDQDAWDLLAATFPAGTLSGAPKIRAMEIIAELEKEPRGPYGGAVGYVSFDGNMDLAITIRTAVIEDGKLTVRAGAGIVADSDPETERVETVNKSMALQRALQLLETTYDLERTLPMIVMIDNYDSFTYNLVQYLRQLGAEVAVYRNDAITVAELKALNPAGIVISPGPGRPESAGISVETIREFSGKLPLLGVCLGHQSIAHAFGGKIVSAKRLMHGKTSTVTADGKGLFKGISEPFQAMRYHSLVAEAETLPSCLTVTATSEDGEIMGIRHTEHQTEGIQFHPESIMTQVGKRLLRNFVNTVGS